MGVFRFRRVGAENLPEGVKREIRFDSSPKYSICKQYGYAQEKFSLRNERQEKNETVYDVYAGNSDTTDTVRHPTKVGTLYYDDPAKRNGWTR